MRTRSPNAIGDRIFNPVAKSVASDPRPSITSSGRLAKSTRYPPSMRRRSPLSVLHAVHRLLSFVIWTLTLAPLLKYVIIVLRADDNGEGGTFALYSLFCLHARVGFLPADHDLDPSAAKKSNGDGGRSGASRVRSVLEEHQVLQRVLLVLALIGTCMVIGDGVFTLAISVFSAVSGVELSLARERHKYGRCLFKYQAYESGLAVKIVTWSPCGQFLAMGSLIRC